MSTGQSLEDKLYAMKYFLSGQGISFVVLKATTSQLIGPKRKHLNYLVNMTNEPNVSIPSLVKHLMIRARNPDWSIAFKAILTIHHLMNYGNEKFIQNLASSTVNKQSFDRLCSFVDRTTTLSYNMSVFVRRYSRYLNVKIHAYRSLGMDFCRIEQQIQPKTTDLFCRTTVANQNPRNMKNMAPQYLMRTLAIFQNQFDMLLAFDASIDDLCNGIINSAFAMLYKEFVKLYITYQSAIIRLLELFFKVRQPKLAKDMLGVYKKFLVRMDKVSDFMRVVDMVGMDKSDMPSFSRSPELPLGSMEKHVENLESQSRSRLSEPLGRMQSMELPRLEYCTLDRPNRRRSLRTPTRQTSMDILSPMAMMNHKNRIEEINHLDRMIGGTTLEPKRNNNLSKPVERIEEDLFEAPIFKENRPASQCSTNNETSDKATTTTTTSTSKTFLKELEDLVELPANDKENPGSTNTNQSNANHMTSQAQLFGVPLI